MGQEVDDDLVRHADEQEQHVGHGHAQQAREGDAAAGPPAAQHADHQPVARDAQQEGQRLHHHQRNEVGLPHPGQDQVLDVPGVGEDAHVVAVHRGVEPRREDVAAATAAVVRGAVVAAQLEVV